MTTPVQVEVPAMEHTLLVADRCDRCGAQAFVKCVIAGSELLFCAHHEHEDKLAEHKVVDKRDTINKEASASSV
jgi:hypothetical protein